MWGYCTAFWLCCLAQRCQELHVYKSLKIKEKKKIPKTLSDVPLLGTHRSGRKLSVTAASAPEPRVGPPWDHWVSVVPEGPG